MPCGVDRLAPQDRVKPHLFATRLRGGIEDDHLDAPLLNALTALFEQHEESSDQSR